jgi:hypothetical protein
LPCNWSSSASNSSSVMSELSLGAGGAAGRHGVGGELAFAVQLIEQRLELGVGDFVTGGAAASGAGAAAGASASALTAFSESSSCSNSLSVMSASASATGSASLRPPARRAGGSARRASAASSSGVAAVIGHARGLRRTCC